MVEYPHPLLPGGLRQLLLWEQRSVPQGTHGQCSSGYGKAQQNNAPPPPPPLTALGGWLFGMEL